MSLTASMLERTLIYRAWQAPFAGQKFAPVLAHNSLPRVRRVLDVACGPGTNTKFFAAAEYLGIDSNERYIHDARRRYNREFIIADARQDLRKHLPSERDRFDFILVNSFLHHLATKEASAILANLTTVLSPDGYINVLELVLPEKPSLASILARCDRGKFARPLKEWRRLFEQHFAEVVFEPYLLGAAGVTLWNMVYFKGKPRI